ncbi:lipopolysaccharide assembly LapA domain-containing protein [uncultured Lactobacillus sp.]|uniref:LapA family protein n=1 Tax=uncultured Lactobacillus sp. TaxID=153152 RepID=UPI002634F814|nr:lipopolysaccharide assembly protein LapA domain-containing protein [uncultured Lactobacillus sp.]
MKQQNSKQSKLVFGLIIVLILVIFACLNIEPVAINFGFYQPQLPLIIVLVIMMLLGAVVSLLLGTGEKGKPNQKALAEQKASLEKEFQKTLAEKNQKISELEAAIDQLQKQKNETSTDKSKI